MGHPPLILTPFFVNVRPSREIRRSLVRVSFF
jgi:hypothetical protein